MNYHRLSNILNCHPIIDMNIKRGNNTCLYTDDEREIIDFESGIWCTALGHCNSKINKAMINQLNNLIHVHYKLTNNLAQNLAFNLLQLVNLNDGKATFLSSGSEAVEFSIRICNLLSKGGKILTFSTSYLSAFSNTNIPRDEGIWAEIDFLRCRHCTADQCAIECDKLQNIDFNNISAFILESAVAGRVLFPPHKLVKLLGEEVKKHGGIIIANEVTTGLGRTGKWFGYQHYDIAPDMVVLGKALGNGYPVSAILMSKDIAHLIEQRNFLYAQSHQNDPLGCAIGNEVIKIMQEDNMMDLSKELGDFFLNQLQKIKDSCKIIKDIRGRGPMLAIELGIDGISEKIFNRMLENGFFIGVVPSFNVLRFSPALTISKAHIIDLCTSLKAVLSDFDDLMK